ncbi:YdcF family protein [Psychrobacillus sp. INOP01]|uniref:YdcF family protein n=1 Tax=Psychrobacillus sp. INOP01 TaxID=2829187 RepID=UPI001BA4C4E1|nr:YdcF family protein [Psychrobacillus sp. INOP01]QUG40019.1 YdcF family protein [Psychrobacillus sp. INOP01]
MKNKFRWLVLIPLIVVVSCGIGIWLLTSKWLEDGLDPKADGTNEYAIVLGAKVKKGNIPSLSLQYRLDAALAYAQKYTHVKLVLSGGQGPDEDIEEAVVMRDFLLENGIDEERLLLEDKATSTYENLLFSQEILPSDINSVTIITSDYHLQRAKILAGKLDWESDVVAAKTPKVVELKVRLRERAALLKAYILGK